MEGSWVGGNTKEAFKVCGYEDIAKKYGVELIDTKKEKYTSYNCGGIDINICDCAMNVDFMINVPVLKGHCQTEVTCALKNNKGIIPDKEKRRFRLTGKFRLPEKTESFCCSADDANTGEVRMQRASPVEAVPQHKDIKNHKKYDKFRKDIDFFHDL